MKFCKTILSVLGLLALCVACTPVQQPEPVQIPPATIEHTIRTEGETLGALANWFYGKSADWTKIVAANPSVKPTRLRLGDVIIIPLEGAVRTDPFPGIQKKKTTVVEKKGIPNTAVPDVSKDETRDDVKISTDAEDVNQDKSAQTQEQGHDQFMSEKKETPRPEVKQVPVEDLTEKTSVDTLPKDLSLQHESDKESDEVDEASPLNAEVSLEPNETAKVETDQSEIGDEVSPESNIESQEREELWEQLLRLGNPEQQASQP